MEIPCHTGILPLRCPAFAYALINTEMEISCHTGILPLRCPTFQKFIDLVTRSYRDPPQDYLTFEKKHDRVTLSCNVSSSALYQLLEILWWSYPLMHSLLLGVMSPLRNPAIDLSCTIETSSTRNPRAFEKSCGGVILSFKDPPPRRDISYLKNPSVDVVIFCSWKGSFMGGGGYLLFEIACDRVIILSYKDPDSSAELSRIWEIMWCSYLAMQRFLHGELSGV